MFLCDQGENRAQERQRAIAQQANAAGRQRVRLFSRVFIIITFNNRWILQFKKTSGIDSCLCGTAVTQWMLTQTESEEIDKNTRISHIKEQELQVITTSLIPQFRKGGGLALRLCIRATKSAQCSYLKRAFRGAASSRIRPAQPPGVNLI